jgi:hypothetical protein
LKCVFQTPDIVVSIRRAQALLSVFFSGVTARPTCNGYGREAKRRRDTLSAVMPSVDPEKRNRCREILYLPPEERNARARECFELLQEVVVRKIIW